MHVEIWSDIACPWCFVGKRRFEAARELYEGDVTVTWRSFELDPDAPAEREQPIREVLAEKYGRTLQEAQQMLDEMRELAAEDGLTLDHERQRGGNTFDGHRLVHLAASQGKADAMKERLLRAYHEEGELVSDHATLVRLAEDAGVTDAEATLGSDRFAAEVREDEEVARGLQIQGVPFFVADRKMAIAGAQSAEFLAELLRQADKR